MKSNHPFCGKPVQLNQYQQDQLSFSIGLDWSHRRQTFPDPFFNDVGHRNQQRKEAIDRRHPKPFLPVSWSYNVVPTPNQQLLSCWGKRERRLLVDISIKSTQQTTEKTQNSHKVDIVLREPWRHDCNCHLVPKIWKTCRGTCQNQTRSLLWQSEVTILITVPKSSDGPKCKYFFVEIVPFMLCNVDIWSCLWWRLLWSVDLTGRRVSCFFGTKISCS